MGLIIKGPPSEGFSYHNFPPRTEVGKAQECESRRVVGGAQTSMGFMGFSSGFDAFSKSCVFENNIF